jgi:predicted amidophosphoribosyltransferase
LSEEIVDRPGVIEPALWGELKFLAEPLCSRCGFPLPDDAGPKAVCGACAGRKPAYDSARAALAYDDHARRLILDLKRGGRRDGLPVFARWMAAAAGETLARCDFIAPAPMHWTRLAVRSFNQARVAGAGAFCDLRKTLEAGRATAGEAPQEPSRPLRFGTAAQCRRRDQGWGAVRGQDDPGGGRCVHHGRDA